MSLPTYARFKKDNEIVGAGFCNIGWVFFINNFSGCIFKAFDEAAKYFDQDITQLDERDLELYNRFKERNSQYFSTRENLFAFDHVELYGYSIPRDIVNSLYRKELSNEDFVTLLKENKWKI